MSTQSMAVNISDACSGMVLAQDLTDACGAVLLPAGCLLDEGNLKLLRRRGIANVVVVAQEEQEEHDEAAKAAAAAARQALCERQCARLGHLFRACAGIGAS